MATGRGPLTCLPTVDVMDIVAAALQVGQVRMHSTSAAKKAAVVVVQCHAAVLPRLQPTSSPIEQHLSYLSVLRFNMMQELRSTQEHVTSIDSRHAVATPSTIIHTSKLASMLSADWR